MIRTPLVAAALAGAVLLAPVAQARPSNTTGPDRSNPTANPAASISNPAALSRGPAVAPTVSKTNRFAPTITATPFGSARTYADQPGLALATANGTRVTPTGTPFGFSNPMPKGNLVGPATQNVSLNGGIRTRHGRAGGSPFGLGGLFG